MSTLRASQVHPRVSPAREAEYRRTEQELDSATRQGSSADRARALRELAALRSSVVGLAVQRGTW